MVMDPHRAYNELPPLPPAVDVESKAVLRAAAAARGALGEVRGIGGLIPNQSILVHAVSLREAQASSEIEGIVTTTDKLFRALSQTSDVANDPQAKEAMRYSDALWFGYGELKRGRPLSTSLFEQIVQRIKGHDLGVRDRPVYIGSSGRVVYTPPDRGEVIRNRLDNLSVYLNQVDEVDPLVRLAVGHYQFEAIHPFLDGNGRVGRIINILHLVQSGLLSFPILYLSSYIINHKADYYRLLREVTEDGAWEPWVLYMLSAVTETASQTRDLVRAIRALMDDYRQRVRERLPKIYTKELVEQLFDRPYCKIAFLVDSGIAKRQTASRYLHELVEAGFLSSEKIGRETVYINHEFLGMLRRRHVDGIDMMTKRVDES